MDDEQIKKLKEEMIDVLILANQSGKKETSNLVYELKAHVKNLNEKIITLTTVIEGHIKKTEDHIKKDTEWKERVAPTVETMQNTKVTFATFREWMKYVAIVSGPITTIFWFLKK